MALAALMDGFLRRRSDDELMRMLDAAARKPNKGHLQVAIYAEMKRRDIERRRAGLHLVK